jgi:hypothetical protein
MGGIEGEIQRLSLWLRRMGLGAFAAALLEAGRPLAPLGAQLSYMVDPLLGGSGLSFLEMGRLLEDPRRLEELAQHLQNGEDGS